MSGTVPGWWGAVLRSIWLELFWYAVMRPCATFDRGVETLGGMSSTVDTQSLEAQMEET